MAEGKGVKYPCSTLINVVYWLAGKRTESLMGVGVLMMRRELPCRDVPSTQEIAKLSFQSAAIPFELIEA